MKIREGNVEDIEQMHRIRLSVSENVLTRPDLVTPDHYREMITSRGKGWVCEADSQLVGFAVVDLQENNVWALFVHPNHERKGIGRKLHDTLLYWYFRQKTSPIWLSTDPDTRAETFYRRAGWEKIGILNNGEIRFEMKRTTWLSQYNPQNMYRR